MVRTDKKPWGRWSCPQIRNRPKPNYATFQPKPKDGHGVSPAPENPRAKQKKKYHVEVSKKTLAAFLKNVKGSLGIRKSLNQT
jgi:hypothetical protein